MASADVFMSSPPRSRVLDPASVSSSSPCLPSLDEIFRRRSPGRQPVRTGMHAAPVPANARVTFTSAADILRAAPEIDIDTETITSSPPRRAKTPTKSRRQEPSGPDNLSNTPTSGQPAVVVGSSSPRDKPWEKFKKNAPIRHDDDQLSLSKPKAPTSKKRSNGVPETVSRHFTTKAGGRPSEDNGKAGATEISTKELSGGTPVNSELDEPALPRRGTWTPPKAGGPIVFELDSDSRELFSSVEKPPASKDVFQTLYRQYGRQESDLPPESCPQPQIDFLRKRKRIEMIIAGREEEGKELSKRGNSPNTSPRTSEQMHRAGPKEPVAKKKTRTITELAIAPFAAPITPFELAGPASKESMLNYFDSDGAVKALVEHQSAVMSQRKPTAKEKKQPPKTKRKKKAGTQANPILLSPSSALKQSSNQDFVFGTSSQLVQEDSPTILRDLQAAIRASNALNSDPFDDGVSQRLWQAGSRDEDGELLGVEVVDLQHSPAVFTAPNSAPTPGGRNFVDINDILDSPQPAGSAFKAPSESEQTKSQPPQSHNTTAISSASSSESEGTVNAKNAEPRPNYELFTDTQLSKQVTSYGFKPVKKRAAMIALLDQCWTSKHQSTSAGLIQHLSTSTSNAALAQDISADEAPSKKSTKPRGRRRLKKNDDTMTSVAKPAPSHELSPKRPRRGSNSKQDKAAPTSTTEPDASLSSPKRPRGRPRKSSSTSIEIPDSENETQSPVSSPDPIFSSPPPLDLATSDEGDMSLALSPTDQQAELFKHITKAVTSTPRSQDPSKPSWYEKMLLYDPIILEELASWLNGGELTRVGYDGEVSPFDVKKWCESKSVICLWRQNLNGKERKRY